MSLLLCQAELQAHEYYYEKPSLSEGGQAHECKKIRRGEVLYLI